MQGLIKSLPVFFVLSLSSLMLSAQDDDCDPSSSIEDVWASKRESFGPNCMQYAINVAMNTAHNRGIPLADGTAIPVFAAERAESPIPGGVWTTAFSESYSWEINEKLRTKVFRRPGTIMNLGPMINIESYTLELDTGIVKIDVNKILKTVRDEFDDYEDELTVTVEPYYENGLLYTKVVGNIMFGEGLKATTAGDIISYFFQSILYRINYDTKYEEMEAVKSIGGLKFDYWNKTALAAALKMREYESANSGIKEGRFNWGESNFGVQVDNYGDYMLTYIRVDNSSDENRDKLVTELNSWLQKEKPKNVESAETKLFGNTPWVVLKFNLKGMKGSDIMSDIYEDVIKDWGEEITDEAKDIMD